MSCPSRYPHGTHRCALYAVIILLFSADTVSQKLRNNNVFTIAKRNVEGQDMLYMSMKLTNGIWVLAELKIAPGNPNFQVRTDMDYMYL